MQDAPSLTILKLAHVQTEPLDDLAPIGDPTSPWHSRSGPLCGQGKCHLLAGLVRARNFCNCPLVGSPPHTLSRSGAWPRQSRGLLLPRLKRNCCPGRQDPPCGGRASRPNALWRRRIERRRTSRSMNEVGSIAPRPSRFPFETDVHGLAAQHWVGLSAFTETRKLALGRRKGEMLKPSENSLRGAANPDQQSSFWMG